jgi:hypothetical protein
MRELDVRHLPVVDGEALVGMLSDRDPGNLDVTRLLTEESADAPIQLRLLGQLLTRFAASLLLLVCRQADQVCCSIPRR